MVRHVVDVAQAQARAVEERLLQLIAIFGSVDQVEMLLHGLLEEGRADLATFDQAVIAGDTLAQHNVLHRITGSLQLLNTELQEPITDLSIPERRKTVLDDFALIDGLLQKIESNRRAEKRG